MERFSTSRKDKCSGWRDKFKKVLQVLLQKAETLSFYFADNKLYDSNYGIAELLR